MPKFKVTANIDSDSKVVVNAQCKDGVLEVDLDINGVKTHEVMHADQINNSPKFPNKSASREDLKYIEKKSSEQKILEKSEHHDQKDNLSDEYVSGAGDTSDSLYILTSSTEEKKKNKRRISGRGISGLFSLPGGVAEGKIKITTDTSMSIADNQEEAIADAAEETQSILDALPVKKPKKTKRFSLMLRKNRKKDKKSKKNKKKKNKKRKDKKNKKGTDEKALEKTEDESESSEDEVSSEDEAYSAPEVLMKSSNKKPVVSGTSSEKIKPDREISEDSAEEIIEKAQISASKIPLDKSNTEESSDKEADKIISSDGDAIEAFSPLNDRRTDHFIPGVRRSSSMSKKDK